jgi:hypothetical protein
LKRWLLVIVGLWFFQGCSTSDSVEVAITFPDQAGKDATVTLRTYSLIPGQGVSCSTLLNGANYPDDGLSTIESQQSASNPFDSSVSPLKVSKKNTATRLFFSQGENDVGMVIVSGCIEVNVTDGGTKVSINLAACEPRCTFGKGNCDNDLKNGCEDDLDTTLHCGGCGKICGNQHALSTACTNRKCSIVCEQYWGNCDQIGSNGCEIDMSDRDNCTSVAKPVFDPPAGTYDHDLDISISCDDPGSTIYYTTNGDTPTTNSTPYTGTPISIDGPDNTITIKAFTTNPGMDQSTVVSATYTVRYKYTLTLTVNYSERGSIAPSSPLTVDHGAATSIMATPNDTYWFDTWTAVPSSGVSFEDANSTSTTVTLTGGDATIQANFVQPTVYVGGYVSGSTSRGIVWKDAIIDKNLGMTPRSVFVSGNDVYVAGDVNNNAVVLKDVVTVLDEGPNDAHATSVFVYNNNVYVAGYENDGTRDVAKVWKSTGGNPYQATALNQGSYSAYDKSVFVSGSDVYVAGYEYDGTRNVAKVWKSSNDNPYEATPLNEGSGDAYATSVFVYDNNIYVAGYEYDVSKSKNVAKVWKNGAIFQTLTNGSNDAHAYSIFVADDIVYAAGDETNGSSAKVLAKVWKDAVPTPLNEWTSLDHYDAYAYSVAVFKNDVYVAGYERNTSNLPVAKVWKNGEATTLPLPAGAALSYAYSLFINVN